MKQYIEHTNLSPIITEATAMEALELAQLYQFHGLCLPPFWVKKARRELGNSPVKLVTVAAFPFGFSRNEPKLTEIGKALEEGADEIDVVMNLTAFKSGNTFWVKVEIAQFAKLIHEAGRILKVIIETAYLDKKEIELACKLCTDAGADFVKTSTGYAPTGAKLEDIKLMRSILPDSVGIKASGGIKTAGQAQAMIEAGAERLGTSSGLAIMEGLSKEK